MIAILAIALPCMAVGYVVDRVCRMLEHQGRAADVAELAKDVEACRLDLESVTMSYGDRLDAAEQKLAAVQSAQALRRR